MSKSNADWRTQLSNLAAARERIGRRTERSAIVAMVEAEREAASSEVVQEAFARLAQAIAARAMR